MADVIKPGALQERCIQSQRREALRRLAGEIAQDSEDLLTATQGQAGLDGWEVITEPFTSPDLLATVRGAVRPKD